MADIEFFFDPICPFAWITSRWVDEVARQTGYEVEWRFIALRLLNKDKDYATHFPPEYPRLHGAGLRMLRVAAAVRAEHGAAAMGPLYSAYGATIWDVGIDGEISSLAGVGDRAHLETVLAAVGHPVAYADAADTEEWDDELLDETELALRRTGRDVGTPIISYLPPDGPSFFGPVISRLPPPEDAVRLWDAVVTLAQWPGFAELKRSLREMPRLAALGAGGDAGPLDDWAGGRRVSP